MSVEKFMLGIENSEYYIRELFDFVVSTKRPVTPLELELIQRMMMSGNSVSFMAYLIGKLVKASELRGGLDG